MRNMIFFLILVAIGAAIVTYFYATMDKHATAPAITSPAPTMPGTPGHSN